MIEKLIEQEHNVHPGLAWPLSPQRPNQINSTSIIRRMAIFLPLTDAEALSITTCNSWDTVLSESYSVSNIGNTDVILDLILPNHDGWLTHAGGPMIDGDSVGIIIVVRRFEKSLIFYSLLLVTRNLL